MDKEKLWQIQNKYSLFKGRILELFEMECHIPSKNLYHNFYSLHYFNWVNLFALTTDYNVILVKQHRMGKNMVTIEVPAGAIDEEEDPLEAGKRELIEETGYIPGQIHLLKEISVNPALQDNTNYSCIAFDCKPTGTTNFDNAEEIELQIMPLNEVIDKLKTGYFDNSLSYLTILLARDYLKEKGILQ